MKPLSNVNKRNLIVAVTICLVGGGWNKRSQMTSCLQAHNITVVMNVKNALLKKLKNGL